MFIGRDLDRVDALTKVLGTAEFAQDLRMEGMLFACVVRSTKPHALLAGIDVSEAMAAPGVLRVVSYRDIPGQNTHGSLRKDQPFLAQSRVRFVGEPILVVIGETEAAAREGAARVRID
jgi:CO/xanthine dehydrogenase Mo-binding subunit